MNKPAQEVTNRSNPPHKPMTLDEARRVMWFQPSLRPLGQLLDEGFLDQARLEWAAANAHDPRLKQAAQVLLDWHRQSPSRPAVEHPGTPFPVRITLEEARATLWPFRPYKNQPMGPLVETRQLSLESLGYAIENAWDERVRQAAMALMLVRLNQAVQEPEPSAGFLHVVSSGRSYAERRQLFLSLIQGFVPGLVLGGAVVFLIWSLEGAVSTSARKALSNSLTSPTGIVIAVIMVGLGLGFARVFDLLIDRIWRRLDRQIQTYRKGQEGEERVVVAMRQALDGNWSLFRNVVLPERKRTDLDSVLVGPPGVWVLEIKTLAGEYRNIGEHWEYRVGNRWKLSKKSPSRQAQDNAVRLSSFLKADSIQQWVTPAVVWANPDSPVMVENPSVAVWTLDRLSDELGNVWHGEAVSEETRNRIVEKLTKLCQEQEKARQQSA